MARRRETRFKPFQAVSSRFRLTAACQLIVAGTFDSALLAGGWNLLTQEGLPCYEECERRGVAVHIAGVFGSGLLVDSVRCGCDVDVMWM